MFTFGNRSLMTTSVTPFTVFEVRKKLDMFSSAAFLFWSLIVARVKFEPESSSSHESSSSQVKFSFFF